MATNLDNLTKNTKQNINQVKKGLSAGQFLSFLGVVIALIAIGWHNYLLFHTIVEFAAMLVAVSIFIIAWNTKDLTKSNITFFLGIGYLFICILTFFHTMTYSGINIIDVSANEPTQFWVAIRFLEAVVLLGATYYHKSSFLQNNWKKVFFIFASVTALIIITILVYPVFPDSFVPGQGLTNFKVYGEYVIILLMSFSIYNLHQARSHFEGLYGNLIAALILSILAELSFTLYTDVYGIFNFAGHFFYLASFLMIYYVVVNKSLSDPFKYLFRELNRETKKLESSNYFLQEVLESLSHPFYVINVDNYEIELANSAAENLNDGKYKTCYGMTHNRETPCDSTEHMCPLKEVKQTGKPVITEHLHQDKNDEDRYYEIHGYPVFDDDEKLKYMIEYSLDITQRKRSEEKISEYMMELEYKSNALEEAKQRLDQEINKAKIIHENTLPSLNTDFEDFDMYAYYQPADNLGGDFYNLIKIGEKYVFYISDVTGHGLDAAMMNSFVKNTISTYIDLIPDPEEVDPKKVLEFLDYRYKQEDYPGDFFITILLGVISPGNNKLTYCSAGMHVSPLVVSSQGIRELPAGNMPISVAVTREELALHNEVVDIPSGAVLFFSTDGLTEQTMGDKTYHKRHYQILKEKYSLTPEKLSDYINKDFQEITGEEIGDDDITYIILRCC
ncbi:MAG: MASE3 domain-containing protein [Halanaerobiaceae bacterium]